MSTRTAVYGFTSTTDAQAAHAEAVRLGLAAELTTHRDSGASRVGVELGPEDASRVADLMARHRGAEEPLG